GSPNRAQQSIRASVGEVDRLVFFGERVDGDNRSEDLVLSDHRSRVDVINDRGREVGAVGKVRIGWRITAEDYVPLGDIGDHRLDAVLLFARDQWTQVLVIDPAADGASSDAFNHPLKARVVHGGRP